MQPSISSILPPDWRVLTTSMAPLPSESHLLIAPVNPVTGEIIEEVELLLYELRQHDSQRLIGVDITYWIAGIAYGKSWYADFLLLHEPTFKKMWGFVPKGEGLASVGDWSPPLPWRLLSPSYWPDLTALEVLNAYLGALRRFRSSLSHFRPEESSLYRTVTEERTFIHFTIKEIEAYVADLRRDRYDRPDSPPSMG